MAEQPDLSESTQEAMLNGMLKIAGSVELDDAALDLIANILGVHLQPGEVPAELISKVMVQGGCPAMPQMENLLKQILQLQQMEAAIGMVESTSTPAFNTSSIRLALNSNSESHVLGNVLFPAGGTDKAMRGTSATWGGWR